VAVPPRPSSLNSVQSILIAIQKIALRRWPLFRAVTKLFRGGFTHSASRRPPGVLVLPPLAFTETGMGERQMSTFYCSVVLSANSPCVYTTNLVFRQLFKDFRRFLVTLFCHSGLQRSTGTLPPPPHKGYSLWCAFCCPVLSLLCCRWNA